MQTKGRKVDEDKEPMRTFQIRLPDELLRRIDTRRLAMTMRPSRSQMIRFLIENALNIMEEGKEPNA